MKKTDVTVNIFVKLVILTLFILFSYYKMRINIFYITAELLLFSFINSFFIKDKKFLFNMEVFSFQAATVFYFERRANFYWREVPEKIYDNFDYVKLLFLLFLVIISIFLYFKSENKYLKKYIYFIFFLLLIMGDIFKVNIFSLIPLGWELWLGFSKGNIALTHLKIDIILVGIFLFFLGRKDNVFFFIYNFIILCLFVRYMTVNLVWGIL